MDLKTEYGSVTMEDVELAILEVRIDQPHIMVRGPMGIYRRLWNQDDIDITRDKIRTRAHMRVLKLMIAKKLDDSEGNSLRSMIFSQDISNLKLAISIIRTKENGKENENC